MGLRHCEERQRRSNPYLCLRHDGLLRFARNDGGARPAPAKVSAITIIYSPKPAENPPVARPTTTKSTRSIDLASLFSSPADAPPAITILGRRFHVQTYCTSVRRRVQRTGFHRHHHRARQRGRKDRDGRRRGDVPLQEYRPERRQ